MCLVCWLHGDTQGLPGAFALPCPRFTLGTTNRSHPRILFEFR